MGGSSFFPGEDLHVISYHKGWVEADTELSNNVISDLSTLIL